MKAFDKTNTRLCNQFENICWIENSGISYDELKQEYKKLMENKDKLSHALIKAKAFELICGKSRIAIDSDDIFQDKIFAADFMTAQRLEWQNEIENGVLNEIHSEMCMAWECGAYRGVGDYGHISPNSQRLLELGFTGLLERIEKYAAGNGLSEKQKDFYLSCSIAMQGCITAAQRLSAAIMPYSAENGLALLNLSRKAPMNIYEAMQALILYFFLHEYVAGARVRTLGRLDVLLYPFYERDIKSGRYTKDEIKQMLKYFLNKFWTAKVPFDLPFCLSGIGKDGEDVTSELTYLIVEAYNELDIHSPKIHIRVSNKTPQDFIKLVLSCIRGGNSSFVFINDDVAIKSLKRVGITEDDAKSFVPIGCYEPASWGNEIGCTGNAMVSLPKAVELVFTNGVDFSSGRKIGIETGTIHSYNDFLNAVKAQIVHMTKRSMEYVKQIEKYYGIIYPDPILSSMYDDSVENGIDVYDGGAKYNNSSLCFHCMASVIDEILAVKKLVFDNNVISFCGLCDVLKNNWSNHERLRILAKSLPQKYGNSNAEADSLTQELSSFLALLVNNEKNSRGGVFKASNFTIDACFYMGERTMATPDGRFSGEPLSKNFCAAAGMDKNGITSLINSVTKMDHSDYPNGSVLDIVLHPSSVSGDEGLDAFYAIIKTYFSKGGFAIHGNIFAPEDLIEAQKNPDKYRNLQVRVCGWNAYFTNLSKAEQDAFIKQAENVC